LTTWLTVVTSVEAHEAAARLRLVTDLDADPTPASVYLRA
jgi:hypothetical protein